MKTLSVFSAFLATLALGSSALANMHGPFSIEAKIFHKVTITGNVAVTSTDGNNCSSIVMNTDQTVMTKNSFSSTEQKCVASVDNKLQGLIFKLQGPPHKWYYVFIGAGEDATNYQGVWYKAANTMDEIEAILRQGNATIPQGWKVVGSGSLMKM